MGFFQVIISFLWGCWSAAQTAWAGHTPFGMFRRILVHRAVLEWISSVILLELVRVLFFG